MSTKCTLKWKEHSECEPGYHLYDDVLDGFDENQEPPVYLRLDGVQVELATLGRGGVSVTVALPRMIARELGLLPAVSNENDVKQNTT